MSHLFSVQSCRPRHVVIIALTVHLAVAMVANGDTSATESAATLQWKNGDELLGQIVRATKNRLIWRSAALSQDMSVDLQSLAAIRFPSEATSESPADTLQCHLHNGDIVAGELKEVTSDRIVLDTARHGVLSIRRSWVARIKSSGVFDSINLVDTQGRGWRSLDSNWSQKQPVLADWKTRDPGQVSTSSPGTRLFLATTLPDSCHIELQVECTTRPAFTLAIGSIDELTDRTGEFELETWGDELVVHSSLAQEKFQHLSQLTPNTNQVRLQVYWDRAAGRMAIYDATAKQWANMATRPQSDNLTGGVLLENRGRDLTVKRLTIDNWIGELRPQAVAGQHRIRTLNGMEFYGRITGPDPDGQLAVSSADGRTTRISREQIAEILFHHSVIADSPKTTCELNFDDGTRLRGELLSITNGIARLSVAYSVAPIDVRLDGLSTCKLSLGASSERYSSQYVLEYRGLRLHGNLAAVGSNLGWRPIGSDDAIPLQTGVGWLIERVDVTTNPASPIPNNLDVIYLRNGDQIPCRVYTIDDQFVMLDTLVSQSDRLPYDKVKAIEFHAESMGEVSGFLDRRWKTTGKQPQKIQRTPDKIVFRGPAEITHPDLLKGGMFEFDIDWTRDAQIVLMITLNTNEGARRSERQMFYLVFSNQQFVQVMVHAASGRTVRQQPVKLQAARKEPLRLRCQINGRNVELLADGDIVGILPIADDSARPTGAVIACQQIRVRNKQVDVEPLVMISNMYAGRGAGLFRNAAIDQSAREHALTVPRSRRNRPPTHMLIAENGDLLRGELVALGRNSVQFRSRMDDVILPRDRLSGIVWLADGESIDSAPNRAGQVQATFPNGVVLEFAPEAIVDDKIVGRHDLLGLCHLSLDAITKLRSGAAEAALNATTFSEWTLVPAREPVIPDASAGPSFGTQSALIGKPAEDFSLSLLDGQPFRLSDHQDKVVVLDFWTTWCGPCIRALPELIQATSEYSADDVLFVAVNQQENAAVVRKFLEDRDWSFTVALDEEGQVGQKYQLEGFPQTVVIGRGGRIEHVRLGFSPDLQSELIETLNELLK